MASLSDKNALMQIIGCLMKAPILLTDQRYIFVKKDFDVPIARGVFLAIQSIYLDYKIENITIVDIDNYFQKTEAGYDNFKKQNGFFRIYRNPNSDFNRVFTRRGERLYRSFSKISW